MQKDLYICIYVILCIFLELQINIIIFPRPPQQKISDYAPVDDEDRALQQVARDRHVSIR